MEARYSKCAFRVSTGQTEQELSEVTRGFADISRMIGDDETELGEIAFDVSSQPENNTTESSDADAASLSADGVASNAVAISLKADDVSSNAATVSSNAGAVSPTVESLVGDWEGLVFSDTPGEDHKEDL